MPIEPVAAPGEAKEGRPYMLFKCLWMIFNGCLQPNIFSFKTTSVYFLSEPVSTCQFFLQRNMNICIPSSLNKCFLHPAAEEDARNTDILSPGCVPGSGCPPVHTEPALKVTRHTEPALLFTHIITHSKFPLNWKNNSYLYIDLWVSITLKSNSCLSTKLMCYFADRINHCSFTKKGCQKRKRNVFLKPCLKLLPVFKGKRKTLIKPPFFVDFGLWTRSYQTERSYIAAKGL